MLFTVTSTAPPATDLGYLLHKHPDRVQPFNLPFGTAVAFYPEAAEERCTFALQIDIDPIALVRRRDHSSIAGYVNDRPYTAGSMLSVAIGRLLGSALHGRCEARPELVNEPLPLTIHLPAVAARPLRSDGGGAGLVKRLFEPLGWAVAAVPEPFGPTEWGDSPYLDVTLTGTLRLADALSHLYVLLPALDGTKHYYSSSDEVDKLIRRGEGWLATHPERELITRRYLARREWAEDALARLDAVDDLPDDEPERSDPDRPAPLKLQRRDAVFRALREIGARTVADVGCGEGFYLAALLDDPTFTRILGVDVSARELDRAEKRLGLDRRSDQQRARVSLRQSSVTYRDDALTGFDALLLVEVIEHLELNRLDSLEANIFQHAHPQHVIVTTPNGAHNAKYGLAPGEIRHADHRFEWSQDEFAEWAAGVAERRGYTVQLRPVGEVDPEYGPPTQMAIFSLGGAR
ncbi:3' terminal RNA ribose 2'-O-methyltransferase Hen1 [Ruaniaceae bacterium KH17]|nr:3' terminal RNA ribose 2'-O-methyltransferase Hen1 [Ruaniaceae bacterium KH17]